MWNLKDYIKVQLKTQGKDPNDVERYVNTSRCLSLCADIANSAKHGELNRASRFVTQARISKVTIRHRTGFRNVPSESPEFDFYALADDPSEVEYRAPVVDETGAVLGDAFDI